MKPRYLFLGVMSLLFILGPFSVVAQTRTAFRFYTEFAPTNGFQFITHLAETNEVPSNNSAHIGAGAFTVTTNYLKGHLGMILANYFWPTFAGIYGPTAPGASGKLIYDLGNASGEMPWPPYPGEVLYRVNVALSPQQQADLENGLWYISLASTNYPAGEIRGQILPAQAVFNAIAFSNQVALTVSAVSNFTYAIQASTNLLTSTWVGLTTNVAPFSFTDPLATNFPERFYRAICVAP